MIRYQDSPIVVGLAKDGRSDHAAAIGAQLALAMRVPLSLIHAVPHPLNPWARINRLHRAAANGLALAGAWQQQEEHVAGLLADSELHGTSPRDLLRVASGRAARVLLDEAHERAASALVLGPHKRRSPFDFGLTARTVLALSRVPVWVQNGAPTPLRDILVGVDLGPSSRYTLAMAGRIAQAFGARLRVEHCLPEMPGFIAPDVGVAIPYPAPDARERREQLSEQLRDLVMETLSGVDIQVSSTLVDEPPVTRFLESYAPADLVVVGTHGHTRRPASVLGTVSYSLLRGARTAALAVPDPNNLPASPAPQHEIQHADR